MHNVAMSKLNFQNKHFGQGLPLSNSSFLFNKATFLHQQKIVPKMEDRTEQIFKGALNAVSMFSPLYPKF